MTVRKKMSPDEIKRRLIADADNPDAWEPLGIVVAASKSPRPVWYGRSHAVEPHRSTKDTDLRDIAFDRTRALKSASRSAQIVNIDEARAHRRAQAQPARDLAAREMEALRRKQLHDAIAALPEGQRHCIQLWLDGFQYSDIAHALGVSIDAVKSRLRDAKRHIRLNVEADDSQKTALDEHRTGGAKGR
ncbi:MAG TPA: sigma factor-like helix-turn-helix DNA-binding protein [Thermoanaerobaculia bacterium]|nr:sigma factor-like helix-turn-helix DNA-binding protein [Thermoanaerobaculia bacterium]